MRSLVLALTLLAAAAPSVAFAEGEAGYRINVDEQGGGRSGFWTNRAPASGGAYRWRLMGVGVGLLAVTGGVMILLVRRAATQRTERTQRSAGDQA